MARRYAYTALRVVRPDGSGAGGAPVTVRKLSTGALATLYNGDALSGGTKPNPLTTDSNGFVSFFAGDLKDNYSVAVPAGLAFEYIEVTADTVENHRQTGEHADGTITADQLAPGIIGSTTDVTIHAAKVRDVHGIPTTLGTEGPAYSTVGGATNDPTFGDITVDTITQGEFAGAVMVNDPATDLASAIAAASTWDTIWIPEGTHTLSSGVTLNAVNLRGVGRNSILRLASGSGTVVTMTAFASLHDLQIVHAGSGVGISINGGATLDNVQVVTYGNSVSLTGVIEWTAIRNCGLLSLSGYGLSMAGASVGSGFLSVSDSVIAPGISLTSPTTNAFGSTFTGCFLQGNSVINVPNTRFYGCVVEGDVTVASTAFPCLLPAQGNVVTGTITGGAYVSSFTTFDWNSGWIDVDNSGGSKTDEYFKVGDSGIGSVFNHGLGTRKLEAMVSVANNSTGSDEVWVLPCGLTDAANGAVVPGVGHLSLHIVDANNAALVMYAGDYQDGSASVAGSSKTIFTAVDSQAIQSATTKAAYNYGAAGGYALDRVWVKVFFRKTF